jgi:S1-C subfamily serine protease
MRTVHLLAISLAFTFISLGPALPQESIRRDIPKFGVPGTFDAPLIEPRGLQVGGFNATTAIAALKRLSPEETLATRGPKEVQLYEKLAPSVVIVITEDGIGSGSLISRDGMILTNWHVVGENKEGGVLFKPRSPWEPLSEASVLLVEVVKIDQLTDLALLRLRTPVPKGINTIELGDPANINVGADVHAIGHPTGETWTYTRGYVSQLRPDYEWVTESGLTHKADVIQTQTPINPGNSGGPLLDDDGRMIGVNSFFASGQGLNFAVSVDEVKLFMKRPDSRLSSRPEPETPKCEGEITFEGRSKSDDADMVAWDSNCDGINNWVVVRPDDESEPIFVFYDNNQDGSPERVTMDNDRDRRWDITYFFEDEDDVPDFIGYHPDGELEPSEVRPYVSANGGPAGSAGYDLATIQRALAAKGYNPGAADGIMGPKTRDAIRKYQAENRLSVTGQPSMELQKILTSG